MPNLIDSVNHVVVVTGAGFSAPSGLPVYRDGTSGSNCLDPELQQLSHASRYGMHLQRLWPHWHRFAAAANAASPNAAHEALARWERLLWARNDGGTPSSFVVVTQNIDGLHQRAGSRRVYEVHGSILKARRLRDFAPAFDYEPDLEHGLPPLSLVEGKHPATRRTRPDIVLFGERPRHLEKVAALVAKADLLVFAGTSGTVWPVAGLVDVAQQAGTQTLLLNLEPWSHGHFDAVVLDDVLALDQLVPR